MFINISHKENCNDPDVLALEFWSIVKIKMG